MLIRTILLLSWCLSLGVNSLRAQADLTVNVVDLTTNQPVAEIPVTLSNLNIGFEATEPTNELGQVTFRAIPAVGEYQAQTPETETYFAGFPSLISLRNNQAASLTLGLTPQAEFEVGEVVIGRTVTQINTVNAEVSAELTAEELRRLPVEGRDISRVLFRLPNVTQATGFFPEAPPVSINGANSLFTNYLIDGMDNNERFLGGMKFRIPIGMVQNLSVLTNNYSAEYGLSANGVVNVTTQSGTNETHGEAFFLTRPGSVIDGTSPFTSFQRDLYGNPVKDGFQRYQGGFAVGGALVKDKTFYQINAEQTVDLKDNLLTSPLLDGAETVRGTNRFTYLSAKLDHRWTSQLRSTLRAHVGLVTLDRQGGGLEGGATFPSAASEQDRNSLLIASQNVYATRRFASETNFQYSRFRWNYFNPLSPEAPGVTLLDPGGNTLALIGRSGYLFDAIENTLQLQQKFTWDLGRHVIKAGANVISADHTLSRANNEQGDYLVSLNQQQIDFVRQNFGSQLTPQDLNQVPGDITVNNYSIQLLNQPFGARQTVASAYVEDQWAMTPRLNVNLGLRYDFDNLSRGGSDQYDLNNLGPRFSANYQLTDRMVLRAGYGIFYDKITYAIWSDALQFNTTSSDYRAQIAELVAQGLLPADTDLDAVTNEGDLAASFPRASYLEGPTAQELRELSPNAYEGLFGGERRILNPSGYANPSAQQFMVGYQLQIKSDLRFGVDLFHNRYENQLRLVDVNAPAAYPEADIEGAPARTVAEADATRPVPILYDEAGLPYSLIGGDTLRGVARNVVMTQSGGQGRYFAATLSFEKQRGDDPFAFRFIYTLSRLENNTDDINFRAEDANDFEAEWGPSINDRTHVINAMVSYFPVKNLTLTAAALIQSGQPINRTPFATPLVDANGNVVLSEVPFTNASGDTLFSANGSPAYQPATTVDLNGDGRLFGDGYTGNSDRYPGAARNADRLPWAVTIDLGAQYSIPVGKHALVVRADVFNVLNAANLSGYSNNATSSNQIQNGPVGGPIVRRNASAPRQFQFGVSYQF